MLAILAFHIGDLLMTLFYRDSGLMLEGNIVAAELVYGESTAAVILFKASMLFVAFVIFWSCRRRITTELACWLILLVMTALTIKWTLYIDAAYELHSYLSGGPVEQEEAVEQIRQGNGVNSPSRTPAVGR